MSSYNIVLNGGIKFDFCMTKEKFMFKANNLCLLNFVKDVAVQFNLKKLKRAFFYELSFTQNMYM